MKAVMLFFLGLLLVLPFISAAYGIGNSNSYGIGSTETSYDIVNAINYTNVNVNNSQWLLGYNWATSPLNASLTAWINGFNYNYNTSSDRVPYTGATQNVNLGENNLTVKSLITTGNVSLNNTLYVSTIGNVGIGTTPATDTNYILLVKRNQDTYTFFRVLNEGTTSGARAGMTLQTGAAGHAGSMQYLSENFVLAPPYDGWRSDSLIFSTGSQADGGIAFINTHASAPTTFNSGGARASDEAMRIAGTTKYVGIGTTTPAEKLGVRGNISASAIYPDLNIQKWRVSAGSSVN